MKQSEASPYTRLLATLLISVAAMTLGGCSTVRSTALSANASDPPARGLTYFLPAKLMKVSAARTPADLGDLQKALAAKKSDAADAKTAADEADAAAAKALIIRDNLAKDPDATTGEMLDAEKALRAAKALKAGTKKVADTLAAEGKAIQATIDSVKANGAACLYEANIELLPAQPDRAQRFVVRPVHNPMRDDTLTLKVGANGLLTSGDVVAADRTGDIIVEAAGAIAALGVKGPVAPSLDILPPVPAPTCADLPPTLVDVFDPNDANSVSDATAHLYAASFPFAVHVVRLAAQAVKTDPESAQWPAAPTAAIYYRSPAPMVVMLDQSTSGPCIDGEAGCNWQHVDSAAVLVPQAGPISYIPMKSSPFVKTVDDVEFADGAIASWNAERPSEVLEIVRLPVKVLTALISVPAQLISLKVNYSTQDKALSDAQKAQIQSSDAFRRLKLCLDSAQDDTAAHDCMK